MPRRASRIHRGLTGARSLVGTRYLADPELRREYAEQIAPIPLGGFVQITGLNPNEEFDKNDPLVYPNRPRWMRLLTIIAGPAANYLTAVVLMLFVLLAFGMPSKTQKIIEPVKGKPAEIAGLKANDVLVAANGQAVSADAPISDVIRGAAGAPVKIEIPTW